MMIFDRKKTKYNDGYALLFAVLVSSILLSAGLGIANIVYKELQLSSVGRESTKAFYVADSGAECALYWNSKSKFPTVAQLQSAGGWVNPTGLKCADNADIYSGVTFSIISVPATVTDPAHNEASGTFNMSQGIGCAMVTVRKTETGTTYIESRGFNLSCSTVDSPRRVERAVRYRIN